MTNLDYARSVGTALNLLREAEERLRHAEKQYVLLANHSFNDDGWTGDVRVLGKIRAALAQLKGAC